MADFKPKIVRHVRSARQWLTRAEDDFTKNDAIRGELNLILAQAELQHLQEAKRNAGRGFSPFMRQIVTALVALCLVGVAFGGAYWTLQRQSVIPVPMANQNTIATQPMHTQGVDLMKQSESAAPVPWTGQVQLVSSIQTAIPSDGIPPAPKSPEPAATVSQSREGMYNKTTAAKDITLPPEEMHKLIRAAGKSLRGQ